MICNEAKEKLQALADGELPGPDRMEVEEHLATCPSCAGEAETIRGNAAYLGERLGLLANRVEIDLAFLEQLPAPAARTEKNAERSGPAADTAGRSSTLARPLVFLLILVPVLAVAGWFSLRPGAESDPDAGGDTAEGGPNGSRAAAADPDRPGPEGHRPTRTGGPPAKPPRTTPDRPSPDRGNRPRQPGPQPVQLGVRQLLPAFLARPSATSFDRLQAALAADPAGASTVIASLDEAEKSEQRALLAAILSGAAAQPDVRHRLTLLLTSDGSPAVRTAAAAALGHVPTGRPERLAGLPGVQLNVGPIEDDDVRRILLDALHTERNSEVLVVILSRLGPSQARDETITDRLVELASSPDETVRRHAAEALKQGQPRDPGRLRTLLEDSRMPAEDRAAYVEPLAKALGERAVSSLVQLLSDSREEAIRSAALRSLAQRPGPEGYQAASRILGDPSESSGVRNAALQAITARPSRDALDLLENAAASESDPGFERVLQDAVTAMKGALRKDEGGDTGEDR